MLRENTISVLNTLLTINNERGEGYRIASSELDDISLTELFVQLSDTSIKCKSELNSEITKLGGSPSEANMIGGDFFSSWSRLKEALLMKDKIGILNSVIREERLAQDAYIHAMENNFKDLTEEMISMIRIQHEWLVADRNSVNEMKDTLNIIGKKI